MDALIERLKEHCRRFPGINEHKRRSSFTILNSSLDIVARFNLEMKPANVMVRCTDAAREALERKGNPGVKVSDRMKWGGPDWKFVDVALDGSLDEATLVELLDGSFRIIVDAFDEKKKFLLDLVQRRLPASENLDLLTEFFGLQEHQMEIRNLALPAYILRTRKAEDAGLGVGTSKIGGIPDLPREAIWPTFENREHLAFLAQINLAELPATGNALPRTGMLYLFSVYGWVDAQGADPRLPSGDYSEDWTRVWHWDVPVAALKRAMVPPKMHIFPAAAVECVPTTCVPMDTDERAVAALNWPQDVKKKYQAMAWSFVNVCQYVLGSSARHLLLGYADYMQGMVREVMQRDLKLLLQIDSDQNTEMGWGDGGNLHFWVEGGALAKWDFDRVFTGYQCG